MRLWMTTGVLALSLAAPQSWAGPRTADEILACVQTTRPLVNTVRTLSLVRHDSVGTETVQRATVHGSEQADGRKTLLIQFVAPDELRGLAVLVLEREGDNDVFVSPAELPEVRKLKGAAGESELFGTDFSYEDVERLWGLDRPLETHKLGRSETPLEGKPFWMLETTPAKDGGSSYSRIVWLVDQETCVLLRAEMYQDETVRKVLTTDPGSVQREGEIWVARDMQIRDLRDGTETRVVIDDLDLNVKHRGVPFTPAELEAHTSAAP